MDIREIADKFVEMGRTYDISIKELRQGLELAESRLARPSVEIFCAGRGRGKTTEMTKKAKDTDGILVVGSKVEANYAHDTFGVDKNHIFTFSEIMRSKGMCQGYQPPVYIDDIPAFLCYLAQYHFPQNSYFAGGSMDQVYLVEGG